MMLALLIVVILSILLADETIASGLKSNETELLAVQALQAFASLPSLHKLLAAEVERNVRVRAVPNIFAQQNGVQPIEGSYQLDNFGALISWDNILNELKRDPRQRLLIMVRHGQAWENLNPTSNANCEFTLDGHIIQNFDSPLTPKGIEQSKSLNSIFRSQVANNSSMTWFENIGLTQDTANFVTSPLSRTMQTTETVFDSLPLPAGKSFIANEIIRATIGRDVCNVRKSVKTPTSSNPLSYPWQSGCKVPDDSLENVYNNSNVRFSFPIRPAGGSGFGLLSDNDQLWRADVADDGIIKTRATAFLGQLYEYTASSSVTAIVTHGEMINAIYLAAGENSYQPKNTEVVPLLLKYNN